VSGYGLDDRATEVRERNYGLHIILRINSNYLPNRRLTIDPCDGHALCFCELGTECLNII
jgi:hypothetical protein